MRFIALLGLAALPLFCAAAEPGSAGSADTPAADLLPLKPFVASYDVKRGGSVIGQSTMTLSQSGGEWHLVTETRGTAGMARLLGLDVREESTFRSGAGGPLESTAYQYRQDATLKSKQRSIAFDASAKEIRVTDKKDLFRYAWQPGTIDRQVVVVALGRQQNAASATFIVAGKDAAENQRFERRETRALDVPAGQFQAVRFERTDKPGKGSSWYATGTLAPLQVEQMQKDGDAIVMELRQLR
jgi:Protein of unknown function (DUF3108)